jgi:hypothetical protein
MVRLDAQIKIENAWLLYNYETLIEWFWTKKAAVREALYESGENEGLLPEHYQVIRGTISIELSE